MEDKYEELYNLIQAELLHSGHIKESLMELCSFERDRNWNDNKINFQFLLESSLETKTELKKTVDRNAKIFGFDINYVNLTGDLY